jgi:hypothetical protein
VVKPALTSSSYSAPAVCYRNFFQKSLPEFWRKKENSTPFILFDALPVKEILKVLAQVRRMFDAKRNLAPFGKSSPG